MSKHFVVDVTDKQAICSKDYSSLACDWSIARS